MTITIAINTYNHAEYLEQALEGVLMQQTTYPYEVLVVDDCSTDGTVDVLLEYARRHPRLIRLIVHERNQGALPSMIELFEQARGDYVATFDGDDYWTDPAKLQLQVSFLEANPDFVLCGHNCVMRNEWAGTETVRPDGGCDRILTTSDLIDVHVPAGSMVFRNGLLRAWPECFRSLAFGDRVLALMLSEVGKVQYWTRTMSVYRIHPHGLWSGTYLVDPYEPIPDTTPDGLAKLVEFWQALVGYLDHRYHGRIHDLIAQTTLAMERRAAESAR
jgi:glycosyltransferase involved in cell wall biosynthesis